MVSGVDRTLTHDGRGGQHRLARQGAELPDADPAQPLGGARRPHPPRPGWYAYRVTGSAALPSWAVEVALTIERPATARMEVAVGSPAEVVWQPSVPDRGSPSAGGAVEALLLVRASGRMPWLQGIAEALAEVEKLAGVRPAVPEGALAEGGGGWGGARLLSGPALPGLTPVTAAVALAHLRVAGSRGLPAPLRRRRPTAGVLELAWRAGAGSVLTCDGPDGRSAQSVVSLRGMGSAVAVHPPPCGALVLRAWRSGQDWGMVCGLVLGATGAAGLGRAAGRAAALARAEGWDASVLNGQAAMALARAGSPGVPAPRDVARAATRTQVAALLQTCLAAGGPEGQAAGARSGLAVTP
jgi:hypothetical protein